MRHEFFGSKGDTTWNLARFQQTTHNFHHVALDIRNREGVLGLFHEHHPNLVIYCAAQLSHDKAKEISLFDLGVFNLS